MKSNSTSEEFKNQPQANHFFKEDTLSVEEKSFLTKVSNENEFIIVSNQVERYFAENDSIPQISKLIFPRDSLIEKGYVYFNLKFYGKIADVNIKYDYSMGQAAVGFGTLVGNNMNNYLHVFETCGITNCLIQVYQNGKKVFEKNDDL
jgi:hypothetical protein